jgi:hypothetical protein
MSLGDWTGYGWAGAHNGGASRSRQARRGRAESMSVKVPRGKRSRLEDSEQGIQGRVRRGSKIL